jgi:hypothetical protein
MQEVHVMYPMQRTARNQARTENWSRRIKTSQCFGWKTPLSQSVVERANEAGGCTLILHTLLKFISSRELSNPVGAGCIRVHMQKLGHTGERCNLWQEKNHWAGLGDNTEHATRLD